MLKEANGARATKHIARLWAHDEVMRTCGSGRTRDHSEASLLAARHQLVTPVSGAVVLENEAQYKQTGLEPVDPTSVPSVVPEPATWLTLAAGAGLIIARRRQVKSLRHS